MIQMFRIQMKINGFDTLVESAKYVKAFFT